MVMSQTLYSALREINPDVQIDVLAPAASLPLVSRMAEVSEGLLFEAGHGELNLPYRRRMGEFLRGNHYDQAIVLPNSLKSALVPFFADIPVRTGFRGEFRYWLLNDIRLLNKQRLPLMTDRFMALSVPTGEPVPALRYPLLQINEINRQKLLQKLSLSLSKPVLGLCPGAEFGDAKKWPEQHYAALADKAIREGMQVWLFGGPKDAETTRLIQQLMDLGNLASVFDLAGQTTLLDAVDLLSLCQRVVSNDSGLMHIAAATGVKTAVVYGSTSPGFTPPLADDAEIFALTMDCRPCFKRTCPLGHKNCLVNLTPDHLDRFIEQGMKPS
ncbi:MAG: lipopolysaccharide heptosyltransferase II [Pseudomonadales bacterium]|nr:lipopolysaccharide heptosyltransferase II [Pseudomonadales bacterium]